MSQGKRTVLYVDDEPSNLVVFEATFEDDFHVITVDNARESLKILEEQEVGVVVADQRMPEITGVEMLQQLRARDPHIQRVILSGFSDTDSIISAINDARVFQFVRKPWNKEELHMVLLRAFDAHDMAVENSTLLDRLVLSERCALLGQSAASIAHEIGNSLNLLPLVEEIESEHSQDDMLMEFAMLARQTHERLVGLIDEIKSFVRQESVEVRMAPMLLADCVRELVRLLRFDRRIDAQRLSVRYEANPLINGNRFKIQQVLINLIQNASDAISGLDQGRVQIRVALGSSGEAQLTVEDNGVGIPEEIRERIWEPFYSTKGKDGNGLGLDIVKTLIRSHGGTIACHSAPGQGTCFRLSFPVLPDSLQGTTLAKDPHADRT